VKIEEANVESAAVYTVHGIRTPQTVSNNIVDLSGLPDGLYFLHIAAGGRQYVKKIIKPGR